LKRETTHRYIYIGSLLLLALATPLSNFLLSIGGILISANWLLSGQWHKKWIRLKAQPTALWLSLFFMLCAITLLYASHLDAGIANLLNKLPLLYAPIILATSNPLNGKEQRAVLNIFLLGVFIGIAASYIHYFTQPVEDIREISVFISHIRFSLCLDLAVCFAIYLGLKVKSYPLPLKIGYFVLAAWLIIYLFFAQTLTGILILFALLLFTFFYILKSKQIVGRKWIALICISAILFFIGYSFMIVRNYYLPKDDETQLAHYTSRGNPYEHDPNSIVENGHKIGLYICPPELAETWNERSNKPYDGYIEATLIRYLNSKGLRKDTDGMNALSKQDIQNVENGIANADYTHGLGVKRSLFPILFSFSVYQHYGDIKYSTILQRVELWKAGYAVCKEHFWFGVGLGDHKPELDKQLDEMNSPMTYKKNMGAHNQFITYCMMGGIFLALYFALILFLPFFKVKNSRHILYQLFFIIVFFSLFTEDTLESQVGVSLYAIFSSFLLFVFSPECCHTDDVSLFQIRCPKRKR
jgi:hypothetical protein